MSTTTQQPTCVQRVSIVEALDLLKQQMVTGYLNWIIDIRATIRLQFITHYQHNCLDPQMLLDPVTEYQFSLADHRIQLNVNGITLVRRSDQRLIYISTESVLSISAVEYPEVAPLTYQLDRVGSTEIARQIRLEQRAEQLEKQQADKERLQSAVRGSIANGVIDLMAFKQHYSNNQRQ